jgi:hypothetical protein
MKKTLHIGIEDPDNGFLSTLPASWMARKQPGLPPFNYFVFEEADLAEARKLWRMAKDAGRNTRWTGLFDTAGDVIEDGYVYKLSEQTTHPGAKLEWNDYLQQRSCPTCKKVYFEIDESAQPRLTVPAGKPVPETFFVGNKGGIIVSGSFIERLRKYDILKGLKLVDLGSDPPCFLLRSDVDIGLYAWDDSVPRCTACGRLKFAPGWFRLFAKPAERADIYFSRQYSPLDTYVAGKLGRALRGSDYLTTTLEFCGWYPDDLEAARYPKLD